MNKEDPALRRQTNTQGALGAAAALPPPRAPPPRRQSCTPGPGRGCGAEAAAQGSCGRNGPGPHSPPPLPGWSAAQGTEVASSQPAPSSNREPQAQGRELRNQAAARIGSGLNACKGDRPVRESKQQPSATPPALTLLSFRPHHQAGRRAPVLGPPNFLVTWAGTHEVAC